VQLFHPNLQARSTHRLGLAADMRRALETGEIEVYFQPKVALPDRRVVGVECLARLDAPAHGEVSPQDFVAVAEHTGQLGRLTDVVLREGLRRARNWLDAGRPLPIAVNLSFRTLIDPTLPPHIAGLLAEYGVSASLLTLEITEDGMVGEPDRSMANLRRLSEMGVRLAVDDFGTGYSSLSYLRRLPVHEVKIDRSFVAGMATDPGDLAIVRAVVDLAGHFGLAVVAEGVESERTSSCSRISDAAWGRASCSAVRCRSSGSRPGSPVRPASSSSPSTSRRSATRNSRRPRMSPRAGG
jgi:EAL domain-containing protein (putative c-di-GMP-specific phosphodiesterase class I)